MIEIKNVTKKFGKFTALDGVTLTINDNECFTILGFNGAGKTTLINILTTVLPKTSGDVIINGFVLGKDNYEIKKIVNVSPQEIAVCKNLTVKENFELIANLYQIEDKESSINNAINNFGLSEKKDVLAKKLSGGQLKRLSIALAVITNPKILFLDEPTLGLDIKARQKLWDTITALKSKMTIFLTTHYLEEVEKLTDKIAVISKGQIKATGTLSELLEKTQTSTLQDAFLKLTEGEE